MGEEAAGAGLRLAIVDDNVEFRRFVRVVAERIGWAVSEFGTGRSFAQSLSGGLFPDRVILDIVMPDMDAIETIPLMARAALRCPIVLISGRLPLYAHSAEKLGRAQGLKIAEVLQKPIALERLRGTLDPRPVPGGK